MDTQYLTATIDENQLAQIRDLEQDLGKVLVAMRPEPTSYSDLTESQLSKIKLVEEKLGMVIVAFDPANP